MIDRTGLLMVYTGNGKGKTTEALGTLMRAYGEDMKVIMLQFIKGKGMRLGEHVAAERMGVEIIPLGNGFTWQSKEIEKDQQLAIECWTVCADKILNSDYDIVILDELTYALKYGWLSISEVLDVLEMRPEQMHIVVTGRDAPPELVAAADMVTEMIEVKHHFKKGVVGQKGIEF
jgi:cob(I)alamin adenosyltransferase